MQAQNGTDERFRELVDQAPFMLWSSGPDASRTFVNRPWLDFRGRTLAQELGDGWLDGIHPDDQRPYMEKYLAAFEARQSFRVEYRLLRADGQYRWVVDAGLPQFSSDGKFLGFASTCIETREPRPAERRAPLTAREVQVLELVADGRSTKEIAAELNISYKTADSHRSRIMEKVGVHETASLVRYAIRQGIVQP